MEPLPPDNPDELLYTSSSSPYVDPEVPPPDVDEFDELPWFCEELLHPPPPLLCPRECPCPRPVENPVRASTNMPATAVSLIPRCITPVLYPPHFRHDAGELTVKPQADGAPDEPQSCR